MSNSHINAIPKDEPIHEDGDINATVSISSNESNYKHKKVLAILIIGDFLSGMRIGLLPALVPALAIAHQCTIIEITSLFGIYYFMRCISSPFIGCLLNRLGVKAVFRGSLFILIFCYLIFGGLHFYKNRILFILSAYSIRIVTGIVHESYHKAINAIFFIHLGKHFLIIFETSLIWYFAGLAISPIFGIYFRNIFEYYTPFIIISILLLLLHIFSNYLIPFYEAEIDLHPNFKWVHDVNEKKYYFLDLIKIPRILFSLYSLFVANGSLIFLHSTLHHKMQNVNVLNDNIIGNVGILLTISGGTIVLTSIPFIMLITKIKRPSILIFIGSLLNAIGCDLIGPAHYLSKFENFEIIIIGIILNGIGVSIIMLFSFHHIMKTVFVRLLLTKNFYAYDIIGSIWNSTLSLGGFVCPTIAGIIYYFFNFSIATYFISGQLYLISIISLYFFISGKMPTTTNAIEISSVNNT